MILPLAYGYCNVSIMPVKTEPSHRAEQCNQLLYGEKVEIIEVNKNDWVHIQSAWDGYKGWCKFSQLAKIIKREFRKDVKYLAGSQADKLVLPTGVIWLPLGCELAGLKGGKITPYNEAGKYKGKKLALKDLVLNAENFTTAAKNYLHAPYQWGGRSTAGIDCSGLVQMALKLCNYPFPRDADQQAHQGELVDFLQNAQCGDLAFFDNKDGKIVHVGLLLDNQTILHATDAAGRVVIDRIDQAGIISTSLRIRTHNLRFVKRILN
jgi:gamma-D-glutamyl-L-lysine dipeptidyl-peptidase